MGLLPEHICGHDIDEVFAYPTTQFARIRDARLGLFKYILTFGIILYVGIYQLWMNGGYLAESTVTGTTRFTLQQPTKNACSPDDVGCKNEFGSIYNLSYCEQSALPYDGDKLPCEFYENIGAQVIHSDSIIIVTRQKVMEQELVCDAAIAATRPDGTCPFIFNSTSETSAYTVDAEKFTILVDHSMVADQFPDIQGTSSKLDGTLLSQHSDHLCKEFDGMTEPRGGYRTHSAPCYILPNQTATGLDYFSLDVLLRAAGTSLEAINYAGQTYRETGMLIQLRITYANFRNWHGSGPIFYYYEPHVVKHSTYKAYDSVYSGPATDYRSGRTLIDKHGVQLISIQGGSVRKFDFLNLLIVLTTSLTLLAVATVVTDFTALYLLPDKHHYNNYKYTDTPDFSDLREQEAREREAAEAEAAGMSNPLLEDDDAGVDERKSGDPGDQAGLRMTAPPPPPPPEPPKSWLFGRFSGGGDEDDAEEAD